MGLRAEISKNPRKLLVRTLERAAGVLVLVDVAIYFVLVWGLGGRLKAAQHEREEMFHGVRLEAGQVAHLERFSAILPDAEHALQSFEQDHVPPRRRGFSRGARLVRKVADDSGVELSTVVYKLYSRQGQPLERLAIHVDVQGSYPGLIKFAHSLETASDLVVVREFSLGPSKEGSLNLRVSADLYLAP